MDGNSDRSLEDKFFEYEVALNKDTFMQQFNVRASCFCAKQPLVCHLLLVPEAQGTGNQEHHLDCRVYISESKGPHWPLHSHLLAFLVIHSPIGLTAGPLAPGSLHLETSLPDG